MLTALRQWAVAYAFTQAIEVPVYLRATNGSWRTSLMASTLTHPLVWFVFPALTVWGVGYWPMVGAAELFALVAEAWWLQLNGVPRALVWSFLANAASAVSGLLLREVFGVP